MPRGLSPRQELLQLQKRIFAQNQEIIRSQAVVNERGFEAYERRYKRQVSKYQRVATIEELLERIDAADIVYLGDYHTNYQSQRTLLRLLKILTEREVPVMVGLEFVQKRQQKYLDDFLADRISEAVFLKRIQFEKYWYFDLWQNFKPIFEYARYHHLPLYGVEWSLGPQATLEKRDQKAAEMVVDLLKRNPDKKLLLFAGDLHLAPAHLPKLVQRGLKERKIVKRDLIIYQNSETIYWQLAEDEVEDKVEIVKIDERSFCIINTPPIVWQQSYLNWLEHEEGEIDFSDAKYHFLGLMHRVAEFLGITDLSGGGEDVEVFTCGDLSFFKKLSESEDISRLELKQIKQQVLAGESYCMPSRHLVYLANLSLNHAAEEAAHYLKYLCSGPESPRDPVDAFYANAMHEALGFFGSKIINQKRKCFHENAYRSIIDYVKSTSSSAGRKQELEIALLVLEHKKLEVRGVPIHSKRFFKSRQPLFFGVTHGLGYILGDRLYYGLIHEKIGKEDIKELFCHPMAKDGEAFQLYLKLCRKLRKVKIPRRI